MKKQDDKRYYLAYGSNLNVPQMRRRCPGATILGTAKLRGWELLFRGSKTGSYLTIEEREGCEVPVAVWVVTPVKKAVTSWPSLRMRKDSISGSAHQSCER